LQPRHLLPLKLSRWLRLAPQVAMAEL